MSTLKILSLTGVKTIVLIGCFLLFNPMPVFSFTWSSIGPGGGGWLSAITILNDNANTIYVGCDVGGIYKSTDHGQTWTIKDKGLSTYYVQDIAYNPNDNNILYAATRGGVFRSDNGGESWQIKRNNFPDESPYVYTAPVSDIVVDPQHSATVYAAIGITRAGYETDSDHWQQDDVIHGTIFKSTNSGEAWSVIYDTGIDPSALIYSLAINPIYTNILYAATDHGMYKSDDFGASWSTINTNLPHHKAMVVVVDPKTPTTLYVSMWAEPGGASWQGGVYKSIDGGDHWVDKNGGFPFPPTEGNSYGLTSNFPVLVIDPEDPDILYTGNTAWTPKPGVYKTIDGGTNWVWVSITPDESDNSNVEMGWISEHGASVKCLAIAPKTPEMLFFGTSTNLFKTIDSGTHWTQSYSSETVSGAWRGTGLETTCVQDIAVDSIDSSIVYVGYWDMGLLKSTDNGQSFRRLVNGMVRENMYDYSANTFSIIVDPANHNNLYIAAGWWEENKGTVCTSNDQGTNWDCEPNGLPDATVWSITLDLTSPVNARILYAASYNNGIYKSVDGGLNWEAVNGGLGVAGNLQVRKVLIDPNDSHVLYAGIEARYFKVNNIDTTVHGGLFRSLDAGESWNRIDNHPKQPSVWDIAVVPGSPGTIYTAASSVYDHSMEEEFFGGVYKSIDGGSQWEGVNNGFGLEENLDVVSIAIHPQNHDILYASTIDMPYHDQDGGRGIFKTVDAGEHWVSVNNGLGIHNVNAITIDPVNPSVLYLGSSGNGAFKGIDAPVEIGDINDDATVDLADIICILQILSDSVPAEQTLNPFAAIEVPVGMVDAISVLRSLSN